jgi:hypothetical protein
MNGIPWWYFYKEGSSFEGTHLSSVDPKGLQWETIGPERAIGCVVDPACEVVEPGVIEHHEFNRFILGEPDRTKSKRVEALSEIMRAANFDAPIREDIRYSVWLKLWGNVCFNPISALTQPGDDPNVSVHGSNYLAAVAGIVLGPLGCQVKRRPARTFRRLIVNIRYLTASASSISSWPLGTSSANFAYELFFATSIQAL